MPVIEKFLKVRTFVTHDGQPTCATNFERNEFCMFFGTQGFGTKEICMATNRRIHRKDGGFTVPVVDCPMKEAKAGWLTEGFNPQSASAEMKGGSDEASIST